MKKFFTKKTVDNILIGVLITLISASIIGLIGLYTDYYITKTKQEIINEGFNRDKENFNKLYRISIKRIDNLEDSFYEFKKTNEKQHEELRNNINQLIYTISKNNKEMKKTLNEIKSASIYGYVYFHQLDTINSYKSIN